MKPRQDKARASGFEICRAQLLDRQSLARLMALRGRIAAGFRIREQLPRTCPRLIRRERSELGEGVSPGLAMRRPILDEIAGAAGRGHADGEAFKIVVPGENVAVGIGAKGIDKPLRYLCHLVSRKQGGSTRG